MAGTSPAKTIKASGAVNYRDWISFPGQPCAVWERGYNAFSSKLLSRTALRESPLPNPPPQAGEG
jgi:hypothetical protein